jgi:hypothetical protein
LQFSSLRFSLERRTCKLFLAHIRHPHIRIPEPISCVIIGVPFLQIPVRDFGNILGFTNISQAHKFLTQFITLPFRDLSRPQVVVVGLYLVQLAACSDSTAEWRWARNMRRRLSIKYSYDKELLNSYNIT